MIVWAFVVKTYGKYLWRSSAKRWQIKVKPLTYRNRCSGKKAVLNFLKTVEPSGRTQHH